MRYQYTLIKEHSSDKFIEEMNRLAEEGWVYVETFDFGNSQYKALMEREVDSYGERPA